jgi:hypothetical protein
MTRIRKIVISYVPLIARLNELGIISTLKSLPDGAALFFCELLFRKSKCGDFEFSQCSEISPAGLTGDGTFIGHIVWSDEGVTAALAATRVEFETRFNHLGYLSASVA